MSNKHRILMTMETRQFPDIVLPPKAKPSDSRSGRVGGLAVFKTLVSSAQRHRHRETIWPLLEWMCLLGVVNPLVPRVLTAATLNWYQRPGRMSVSLAPRCVVCGGSGGAWVGGRHNMKAQAQRGIKYWWWSLNTEFQESQCVQYTQRGTHSAGS